MFKNDDLCEREITEGKALLNQLKNENADQAQIRKAYVSLQGYERNLMIKKNIGDLKETKKEFVPEDGWILPEMEVKFTTGDTVFDILKKICGEKNIQLSSKYTPLYKAITWKASISFMNLTAEKILAGCTV